MAPYLTLDGDPYPAVVDGRIKWILDGYTTTAHYPYSRLQVLDAATADSLTATVEQRGRAAGSERSTTSATR